jgi:hypothetical protein
MLLSRLMLIKPGAGLRERGAMRRSKQQVNGFRFMAEYLSRLRGAKPQICAGL